MHRRALVALTAAAALVPASAAASSWTPTQSFSVGKEYEPVPRAAIARDGTSALVWRSKSGKLMLTTSRSDGHFSDAQRIDESGARDWSVAAREDGGFLVAWEDGDGIRVAVRTRSGQAIEKRLLTSSNGSEINGVQVAADPRGGWVLAERQFRRQPSRQYHVRAMTLSPGGRLDGVVQELGPGHFGVDARPTQAIAVDGAGRAVLAFRREGTLTPITPGTAVVSTRLHSGTFGEPVALAGPPAGDPRVAVSDGGGGGALIAATQVRSSGDAGEFGNPVVARLDAAGALGSPFGPSIANPKRAFGPTAALLSGGRSVPVFSLKSSSQPFESRAPVRAVAIAADGTIGSQQTLTSAKAKEPVAMPLSNGRALTMWSEADRIGASLAGSDGDFDKTAVPQGPPPPPFHFNSTNRDLRTGGRYAIFTWSRESDGRVRVSVRRF